MLRLRHKLTLLLFSVAAITLAATFIVPRVSAFPVNCPDGTTQDAGSADAADHVCDAHQQASTQSACEQSPSTPGCGAVFSNGDPCQGKAYCDFVDTYINPALNFLAVGFGLIVTITVVVSGIQYITSGGNPQGVNAAKKRIFNAVGALLLFAFMWALLQWLVPGGLF